MTMAVSSSSSTTARRIGHCWKRALFQASSSSSSLSSSSRDGSLHLTAVVAATVGLLCGTAVWKRHYQRRRKEDLGEGGGEDSSSSSRRKTCFPADWSPSRRDDDGVFVQQQHNRWSTSLAQRLLAISRRATASLVTPRRRVVAAAQCEGGLLDVELDFGDYSETERFSQVLQYHQSLLPDYLARWQRGHNHRRYSHVPRAKVSWPKHIPLESEIHSLELDLRFAKQQQSQSSRSSSDARSRGCQDLEFRVASYYLAQSDPQLQRKGFQMVKDLAENGHADGMCYYGILLNHGKIEGVDANPKLAVVWWRRCVDLHRHIWASFEMGVAFYTGEGVSENPALASQFFRWSAHLGHAGAAYMLGELLLHGAVSACGGFVVERDRASALEWIVTAAELGHQRARERVLFVLQQDHDRVVREGSSDDDDDDDDDLDDHDDIESDNDNGSSKVRRRESLKWVSEPPDKSLGREVLIERRHTIGGGSANPSVLKRRYTIVEESREQTDTSSKTQ